MPSGLRSVLWPLAVAAVLVLCVGIVASTDAELGRAISTNRAAAELIYLPPTHFLRAVSLGYEHALADILWFRTINYFGDHYWSDRTYPWLAYMCDVVTDLDPRAVHVYEFGGVMLPWVADRADDGLMLLEKGVRKIPDSWRLRYLLGFNYYYFKDDLPAATRAFESAMHLPDTPEFVSRMAATIAAAHQGADNAIAFLLEMRRNTPNEEMRAALGERILELALTRDIDALDAAVAAFEARLGRKPADLGELVASGIVAAIPADPFGGQYVLDAENGTVRSTSGHEPRRLQRSKLRERFLKGSPAGGPP
jgi:hypothetical protein